MRSSPCRRHINQKIRDKLDVLLGDWALTLSNAWFLDSLDTEVRGSATIEWLDNAFFVLRSELGGDPAWDFVIGRNDPHEAYTGHTWRKDFDLIFERVTQGN
jgi:hypothetical protein